MYKFFISSDKISLATKEKKQNGFLQYLLKMTKIHDSKITTNVEEKNKFE